MKWVLFIAVVIFSTWVLFGQTIDLGRITSHQSLIWDYNTNDAITGFKVYVKGTNSVVVTVFTVTTNSWHGSTNKSLIGWREVYVTATTQDEESTPSETVLVYFTGGRPSNPTNIQLYSMTTFVATNALPILNLPPLPP